jgi:four helix bundle protein
MTHCLAFWVRRHSSSAYRGQCSPTRDSKPGSFATNLSWQFIALRLSWPTHERYGLTSQIQRAAVSAAANIAEGAAKRGSREFRRYLDIALGSLAETSYLLMLAKDLRLISPADWATLDGLRKRAGGLTWRLAQSLRASA